MHEDVGSRLCQASLANVMILSAKVAAYLTATENNKDIHAAM
jgi:hypothetical protein